VQSLVLSSGWRQHNQPTLEIDLAPPKPTNLFAPLRGEDQEPNDVTELIRLKRGPDFRKLVLC
jgi:hypothetical protein